jgi:hypothetical protein
VAVDEVAAEVPAAVVPAAEVLAGVMLADEEATNTKNAQAITQRF